MYFSFMSLNYHLYIKINCYTCTLHLPYNELDVNDQIKVCDHIAELMSTSSPLTNQRKSNEQPVPQCVFVSLFVFIQNVFVVYF